MALSLSLVYIPIPHLPDASKSTLFGSKLTWSVYSGMDILAMSIGCTGQVLEEVMDAKYLGVTLNNDLEWSKHIAAMTNKANSKLSFLRRNLKGCPEKLKKTAYFSLIRSFMEYGATVWDPYQKYNSDKVERVSVELQGSSKVGI